MSVPRLPEKALKPYLLSLTLIFCASFVAGFLIPLSVRQQVLETYLSAFVSALDLSGGTLFAYILLQNVTVSLSVLVLGLLLGLVPLLCFSLNGLVLGVVYVQVAEVLGYWKATLKIVPHGILEIPALLIAASYGLWLGVNVLRRIRGKESEPVGAQMRHALKRYVIVVVPLLIVAAGIETILIFAK
jgi:stage II sporulation protein M